MKHIVKHLHFIGIGGAGMSGIAEVLVNLGYQVTGSDLSHNVLIERLEALGARVAIGHDPAHIAGANAVVVSTAVRSDNPEVLAARRLHVPIVPRAVMLAELMRLKQGIAIAGTHGKTTTTGLVASVLAAGGLDPTFVIGGSLISTGTNACLGSGDFIVTEADESDASFLNLYPVIEVITNIDEDHMDTYGHDFSRLKQAFIEFTQRLPFYGSAVVCVDDPNVRQIIPFISKPVVRYGFSPDAEVRAEQVDARDGRMHFTVIRDGHEPLPVVLNLPGLHNVQNALAAITIATDLGVADAAIQQVLADFNGMGRRFQCYGALAATDGGSYTLIDDYGHHPVEMAATIAAARGAFPGRRLVLAFQPYRYTRMRDCFEDFVNVLSTVDALVLTEVYAACEAVIPTVSGEALSRALCEIGRVNPSFVTGVDEVPVALAQIVRAGDVVITMGAGSIGEVPGRIVQQQQ
ncbi:MAG: UDP-N-acetylmuramate--L-alanine ligase [Burkholderia sp.]|nr:MAG: UDP-N-acetylmuramate--L-alanine ligase [Burkholderia gladioli]